MLPAHLINRNSQNENNNSNQTNQNTTSQQQRTTTPQRPQNTVPARPPTTVPRNIPVPPQQRTTTPPQTQNIQQQNEINNNNQAGIIRRSGYLYLPFDRTSKITDALIKLKLEMFDIYPNIPVFLPHWFQIIKKGQLFIDILMVGDASGIVMISEDNINSPNIISEAINKVNTEINMQRFYTIQFTPLIQLSKSNTYNVQYTDSITNEQYNLIAVKFRVLAESVSILKDTLKHYINNTLDNIGIGDKSFIPIPIGKFNINQQRASNMFRDYHQMQIYRINDELLITGFPLDIEPAIYPTFQPIVVIPLSKLSAQFILSSIEEII